MCQGRHLRDELRRPSSSMMMLPLTARLAAANAELVAARARLVESMAELERERARAADLRRRLAESFAEHDRLLKKLRLAAVSRT